MESPRDQMRQHTGQTLRRTALYFGSIVRRFRDEQVKAVTLIGPNLAPCHLGSAAKRSSSDRMAESNGRLLRCVRGSIDRKASQRYTLARRKQGSQNT